MRTLDIVKEKFAELFPPEENVRDSRFKIASYRCEFCGGKTKLELHHLIEGKLRRDFFERVFTVRVSCENCHKMSGKAEMIKRSRSELNQNLMPFFTDNEILTITGKTRLI